MARIRTVKPEFFEDEELAKLPPHDRLLFIGIWLLADKNGILEDRPTWIKAKIFPYENGDTVDVSRMLPRLVSGRYLVRYTVDGRKLIAVRNFAKHQRITGKEGLSEGRYPLPDKDLEQEKNHGHIGDTPETHPDVQEREQGTGNREQGNDSFTVAAAPESKPVRKAQEVFGPEIQTNTGKPWQLPLTTAKRHMTAYGYGEAELIRQLERIAKHKAELPQEKRPGFGGMHKIIESWLVQHAPRSAATETGPRAPRLSPDAYAAAMEAQNEMTRRETA